MHDAAAPDAALHGASHGNDWAFRPAPKIAAALRSVDPERTEARVRRIQKLVPITRLSDLTPLDPLRLPVYSAVTPLARDLTVHMGKGVDAVSARVSALMEAVERVSAEEAPPGSTLRASFAQLRGEGGRPAVDPLAFDLPADSAYAPDRVFTWVEGFDLLARTPVLLPTDLAVNPPGEGILRDVDSNGLAAGNTWLEAVVHALCEVVERDLLGQMEFVALFADLADPRPPTQEIDLATLPEPARGWAERLSAHGLDLDLALYDWTGDLGVPTFRAVVSDYAYPSPAGPVALHFPGSGTAPQAATAALRAITEAVQSRLGVVLGARDAFNVDRFGVRADTRRERLRQMQASSRASFARTPSFESPDLLADLEWLLGRLAGAGFTQVLAVDLTRADLGVPVVRVRVPGLTSFYGNRRRIGWRCLRHLL